MIKSFAHKGLETFFLTGSIKGIQAKHAIRLEGLLDRLHAASSVQDMDFPAQDCTRSRVIYASIGA